MHSGGRPMVFVDEFDCWDRGSLRMTPVFLFWKSASANINQEYSWLRRIIKEFYTLGSNSVSHDTSVLFLCHGSANQGG